MNPVTATDRPVRRGIRVFATASGAPRVRRSTDAASVVALTILVVFLVAVVARGTAFDDAWADVVPLLPGWVRWLSQVAYVVGVTYVAVLVLGVALFARGRLELVRDLLLSAALAIATALVLTGLVDDRWPAASLTDLDQTATTFPAFLLTAVVAVQSAAGPHLSLPTRRFGWWTVLGAAIGAVTGGVAQPADTVGAVAVGLLSAAVIRLTMGTSAGVPSLGRVRDGLAELGVQIDDLRYADEQPTGYSAAEGTTSAGDPVMIRVVGRDAWASRRWSRAWRFAWYQDDGSQLGSTRREQVEHEALVGLVARGAGVSVSELVAVGMSSSEDAMLVARRLPRRLDDCSPDSLTDQVLDRVWEEVDKLHTAGIAHGRLNTASVWLDADGHPALGDASAATLPAPARAQLGDVAELLTSLSLSVGPGRAISAARRGVGDDRLADALPVLQPAALTPMTKAAARQQDLDVDELRDRTAADLGVTDPELERLQRVSIGNVLMVTITVLAVYTVVSGLAGIGFETILEVLQDATWGLVLVALVLTQLTNATDAYSVAAASPKPVPVGITTVEQFAIGFVNLAVPSTAGRIAVNARFFQRLGINAVTSSTTAAITGLVGFVAQTILLVLSVVVGEGSIDLSSLETGGGVLRVLAAVVVAVVVGIVVVLLVPRWRHRLVGKIREPLAQMGDAIEVIRHPRNLVRILGAALGTELLYAGGLTLCVYAVGGTIGLGEAVFINVVVSLFAGLMPVPGGIGVSEAGLFAGLTAVGVEQDTAVAAVIVYRCCSYYLPPIWGWASMRWLTNHEYL